MSGVAFGGAPAAAPSPPAAPTAVPPPSPSPVAVRSGLARLSGELAAALRGSVPAGALVASAPLRADQPAPRGAELANKIAALVAGALGPSIASAPAPESMDAVRATDPHTAVLVYLTPQIADGALAVTADVHRIPLNIWDRVRVLATGPIAHAFASTPIDAEVRSFLAPIALIAPHAETAVLDDTDVVALACGDLDGDGGPELAVIGRRRIAVGRVRGGHFVADRARPWSELSPVAPAPPREPFAGARIEVDAAGRRFLDAGLSDRAHGVRLDSTLSRATPLRGLPIGSTGGAPLCARTVGVPASLADVSACSSASPPAPLASTASPFGPSSIDAMAMATLVSVNGATYAVEATHAASSLSLHVGSIAAEWPGTGAQLAIGDLDEDGAPEILTTLDVLPPDPDALVVLSWKPGERPVERTRTEVAAGVRAVAVCPPDGPGVAAIALATGAGELWILR